MSLVCQLPTCVCVELLILQVFKYHHLTQFLQQLFRKFSITFLRFTGVILRTVTLNADLYIKVQVLLCTKQDWIKWKLRERKEKEWEIDLETFYNQGKKKNKTKSSYKFMEKMKDFRTWMSIGKRLRHSRIREWHVKSRRLGPQPGNAMPSHLVGIEGFYSKEAI